jgi:hypothetical protein
VSPVAELLASFDRWTSPCEKWAPESAEAFSAAERGVEWDHDRVAVVGWQVAAALMGPVGVEVLDVLR